MTTTELELAVLRALCAQPESDAAWARLAHELKGYRWEDGDHKAIYEALVEISSADFETLRRQLPAATARMGFPDIDWQRYFGPASIPADLDELIRTLKRRVKPATEPTI